MKKHIIIIITILVISTSINVFTITRAVNLKESTVTTTKPQEYQYILKDYGGRIAVFEKNNEKPLEVHDIFTSTLPEIDAQNLRKGIKVTAEEIDKFLYEYTS